MKTILSLAVILSASLAAAAEQPLITKTSSHWVLPTHQAPQFISSTSCVVTASDIHIERTYYMSNGKPFTKIQKTDFSIAPDDLPRVQKDIAELNLNGGFDKIGTIQLVEGDRYEVDVYRGGEAINIAYAGTASGTGNFNVLGRSSARDLIEVAEALCPDSMLK